MDDTKPCESCGAALPRTGTYCLACDTPVSGLVEGRLDAADADSVRHGRPFQGIALVGGILVGLAGLTWVLVLVIRPQPAATAHPHRHRHTHAVVQPSPAANQ